MQLCKYLLKSFFVKKKKPYLIIKGHKSCDKCEVLIYEALKNLKEIRILKILLPKIISYLRSKEQIYEWVHFAAPFKTI